MISGRVLLTVAVVLVSAVSLSEARGSDAVLMSKVNAITLRKGQETQGRRSTVPQLKCVGGSAQCRYEPEHVLCTNMGFDGRDATWKCQADMPDDYKFGAIEVVCEGYDHPDDEYITAGSCGLEYKLELTPEGSGGRSSYNPRTIDSYNKESSPVVTWIMIAAVVGIGYYIAKGFCTPEEGRARGRGGGGGAGPDDRGDAPGARGPAGYDDPSYDPPTKGAPPPSYASQGPAGGGGSYGNTQQRGGSSTYTSYYQQPAAAAAAPAAQGGYGLGSLLGAGLMGYMMGGRNNGPRYGNGYGYGTGYGGGGLFGRGGGYGGGFGGGGFGGGGGRPSSGGGTHSSSGFGGTRRR